MQIIHPAATCLLLLPILSAWPGQGRAADLDALLAGLARTPPSETVFVEQRGSALLTEPLLLRGQLAQPSAEVLVKEVRHPHAERTTIASGRVEIEREGERRRRFSLRNAPELVALLASFQGLLAGDRALLEKHYSLALQSSAPSWTLTLTPTDPRLARRVALVRLSGRDHELRCMELIESDGDSSRTLLGRSAEAIGIDTAMDAIEAALDDACHAGT